MAQDASARSIAAWVGFFHLLSWAVVVGGAYGVLRRVAPMVQGATAEAAAGTGAERLAQWSSSALDNFWTLFAPAALLFFVLAALLTYLAIRPARRRSRAAVLPAAPAAAPDKEMDQRLFLHLIGVLQREGRLLDFFSENLSSYEDSQIGAAVRTVHENCNRALHKYLAPQAVLDQNEGEEIAVPPDFDPNSLKLVGNVTGRPPFRGIVRHRGWRVRTMDLPVFSGQQDVHIIAPAEVEIR